MNDALEISTRRLGEARQRGDADDIAEALALHANDLLQSGRTTDARLELDEAAAIHRARGRVYDEARCTQLAGTLCRFEGRLDEARDRSTRALELSESKGPIAVSAYAELGEIGLAEGNHAEAASAYRAALDTGEATGLVDPARAALLRKRAVALTAARRYDDAVHDLEAAHDLLVRAGDRAGAIRALIEAATAFRHAGRFEESDRIVRRALDPARQADDHAALADLHLLLTAQALDGRDVARAMASAQTARTQSLAANAPTSYIGAALAIAQLAESTGDRAGAYEALAVGWATLADLLGHDLARMTFEPKLKEMRERWGAPAFDEVRNAYEAHRERRVPDRAKPEGSHSEG
jgi:tetratricopeptide (TPR) repeat protein